MQRAFARTMTRLLFAGIAFALAACADRASTSPLPDGDATAPAPDMARPPVMVRPCPHASATGNWESITPQTVSLDPGFPTPAGQNFGAHAFVIDPDDPATIYLGTSAQGIYKSTDCGANWTHINTGANGALLDQGRNWTMAIDPVDSQTIYSNAGYDPVQMGGAWKSTNGGVDWQQIFTPSVIDVFGENGINGGFVHVLTIDPIVSGHLIVTPHFSCQGAHSASCILATSDGAATWTVLEDAPVCRDGGTGCLEGSAQAMIDSDTWLWAGWGGVWRTADAGASWTQVFDNNGGLASPDYVHVDDGTASGVYYIPDQTFGILKSPDKGVTWTPIAGSPHAAHIAASETTLFADAGQDDYSSAPLADLSRWTALPSLPAAAATVMNAQAGKLAYDRSHHILYSLNLTGGFWRLVQ
jgi:hypothetical protein